jgi:hypothetical protein
VEIVAGARPTVLACEDLHWGEADLLDFVEYLAQPAIPSAGAERVHLSE